MVGPTEPKNAQPGTIRGDYAHIGFSYADPKGLWIPNLVHASSNAEEAAQEIAHWFSESELFEYESGSDRFVQPRTRNHMRKIKVDK